MISCGEKSLIVDWWTADYLKLSSQPDEDWLRFINKEALKMSKKQKKMQTGKHFFRRISPILFKLGTSIVNGSDVGYRRKDKNEPGKILTFQFTFTHWDQRDKLVKRGVENVAQCKLPPVKNPSPETRQAHFRNYWHFSAQYWQFLLFGLNFKDELGKNIYKTLDQVQTLNDFQ